MNPHIIPANRRHPKQYRSPRWRQAQQTSALEEKPIDLDENSSSEEGEEGPEDDSSE